jgi:hypothetical protein
MVVTMHVSVLLLLKLLLYKQCSVYTILLNCYGSLVLLLLFLDHVVDVF